MTAPELLGRLLLDDGIVRGRIRIADGRISDVDVDDRDDGVQGAALPIVAPGFVDLHVHGYAGASAMAGPDALSAMARALLRRGVTAFLPTAVTAPIDDLARFAEDVRSWRPQRRRDEATALGFNLEGPFLSSEKRGAHDAMHLRVPADVAPSALDPLLEGLRVTTIAPELPGALDLIRRLVTVGVVVSLGHSAATLAEARAGFAAGARSTTHLFNAMTGLAHRDPGLAAAALLDDAVAVELIADGFHVDPALWPIVVRTKPVDRVVLVSDAVAIAGTTETQTRLGTMDVAVRDGRAVVAGTSTLAGSVIALDDAVRQLVGAGIGLPTALVGASRNPLELLGEAGRGRIAVDHVADLVVLDESLRVGRVMREGRWLDA